MLRKAIGGREEFAEEPNQTNRERECSVNTTREALFLSRLEILPFFERFVFGMGVVSTTLTDPRRARARCVRDARS